MGRHFFAIIICILMASNSFGQNSTEIPSLKELATWSGMTYAKLEAALLEYRFTFKEKKTDYWTKHISYIFLRQTPQGDSSVTERVILKPGKDGSLGVEAFFSKDIFSLYAAQLSASNFKTADCKHEVGENVKQYCYSNDSCFFTITHKTSKSENGQVVNSYSAFIYRISTN